MAAASPPDRPSALDAPPVVGLVLAGGRSRRMAGGEKAFAALAGRPLIGHVIARFAPQVATLVISAHGDPARFAAFGAPVIGDPVADHAGPLAGLLAGLDWAAAHRPEARFVASVSNDVPFVPRDLVDRLADAIGRASADLACAASLGRRHPTAGLWPVALRGALRRAVVEEGVRKVEDWTGRYRAAVVDFSDPAGDPFLNVNTPEDLMRAERRIAEARSQA
jgi:molybdenum cofactor guanylyltransferase